MQRVVHGAGRFSACLGEETTTWLSFTAVTHRSRVTDPSLSQLGSPHRFRKQDQPSPSSRAAMLRCSNGRWMVLETLPCRNLCPPRQFRSPRRALGGAHIPYDRNIRRAARRRQSLCPEPVSSRASGDDGAAEGWLHRGHIPSPDRFSCAIQNNYHQSIPCCEWFSSCIENTTLSLACPTKPWRGNISMDWQTTNLYDTSSPPRSNPLSTYMGGELRHIACQQINRPCQPNQRTRRQEEKDQPPLSSRCKSAKRADDRHRDRTSCASRRPAAASSATVGVHLDGPPRQAPPHNHPASLFCMAPNTATALGSVDAFCCCLPGYTQNCHRFPPPPFPSCPRAAAASEEANKMRFLLAGDEQRTRRAQIHHLHR